MFKSKYIYNSLLIFISLIGFLFITSKADAGFGVSPSDIIYDHMKPGDHYEKKLVISRSTADEDLDIIIEPSLGGTSDWVTFKPGNEFLFEKGENRKEIYVVIDVPENAEYSDYDGTIRIKAKSQEGNKSGVSVVKGAKVNVELVTTDEDISSIVIRDVRFQETEAGEPLLLNIYMENTGNTPASPTKVEMEVINLNEESMETLEGGPVEKVEVGQARTVTSEFRPSVGIGEYYGLIKIYLDDQILREDKLYFRITEKIEQLEEKKDQVVPVVPGQVTDKDRYIDLSDPMIALFMFILILFIILLLVFILKRKKGEEAYKYITYVLGFFLVFVIISVIAVIMYKEQEKKTLPPVPYLAVNKTPNESEDVTYDEEVKGVSTDEVEEVSASVIESDVVENPNLSVLPQAGSVYHIYEDADVSSDVIYTAETDERFLVIDENEEWFYVEVGNGEEGWLEKKSVKSIN